MGKKKQGTCSLQIYKDGKLLKGTAAQLHYTKEHGGWDNYHYELVEKITEEVYGKFMAEQNRPVLKLVK